MAALQIHLRREDFVLSLAMEAAALLLEESPRISVQAELSGAVGVSLLGAAELYLHASLVQHLEA